MRADRLLTITLLLQNRGRLSASEIASMLEVSERTVLRDMEALSTAGIPVYAIRGPGGGFELVPGFRADFAAFDESESAALSLLALPDALSGLGLDDAARRLRLKIEQALPPKGRDAAALVAERFLHDPGPPGPDVSAPLAFIRQAIWRQREIVARIAGERATLEPLGLVLRIRTWYVVSLTNDALVAHEVAGLSAFETTGRRFERPAGFDLQRAWMGRAATMANDA